jgi:hypothetical protein
MYNNIPNSKTGEKIIIIVRITKNENRNKNAITDKPIGSGYFSI